MMRQFFLLMLTSLLLLTVGLLPSERADAQPVDASASQVIALVNDLRASKNLPPYQVNSILMGIAQAHADYISGSGVSTHFSADGSRPYQRAITAGYSVVGDLTQGGLFAENITMGKGLNVEDAVKKWQDNSTDLGTLLSPDLKDVGVGVKDAGGVSYYVLDAGLSTADSPTSAVTLTSTSVSTTNIPGVPVVTSTAMDDGTVYHVVQAKEALWNIALAYQISVEQLKSLNGLPSNDIYEGQKLLIQRPKKATATPKVVITATFGIPTSTATVPVTPMNTPTSTPLPTPPTSRRTGEIAVGAIVLTALIAAAVGSLLGRQKKVVSKENSGAEDD